MTGDLYTKRTICKPSEDILAWEIEGEIVIAPLTDGVGDLEDEIYTLKETGKVLWERLDGNKTLGEVAAELAQEFEGPPEEIERDVIGLATELMQRRILAEVPKS